MSSPKTYVIRVVGDSTVYYWESSANSPKEAILEFESLRKQRVASINGADRSRYLPVD